jgi:ligand-binding sensor domain-containing protein/signal transduction histidine kinase
MAVATAGVALLLSRAALVSAQQLPVRHYDEQDGLASYRVESIYQDTRGYLWFGTWNGLSRFDGYHFTSYGPRDGLEHPLINAIVEDRQGRLWMGTYGSGVARLVDNPQGAPSFGQDASARATPKKFLSFPVASQPESNIVFTMLVDADNTLWCGIITGLYRARVSPMGDLQFELVVPVSSGWPGLADSQGRLWFGMKSELIRIVRGHIIKYVPPDEPRLGDIASLVQDHQGRLLVAYDHAVFEFTAPTDSPQANSSSVSRRSRGQWKKVPLTLRPDQQIFSLLTDSTGALWIGTREGLIKYHQGQQTEYTTAQGLSDNHILALREDREGNLWVGTKDGGVCKLSREMIVSVTKSDGLPDQNVFKVIEDHQGRIYASTEQGGLAEIMNGKAVPIPGTQAPPFNNIQKRILQDCRDDWWVGTDVGLFRFPGPKLQFDRGKKFTAADGILEVGITAGPGMYEDPAGRLWVSTGDKNLYRFDPARERGSRGAEEQGDGEYSIRNPQSAIRNPLGATPFTPMLDMMTDRSGGLWLASYGPLGRVAKGKVVVFQPTEGLPEVAARAFLLDRRGWLWIGLRWKGVAMTKNPTAEPPTFVNYSTQNGLADDTVWSIAEDDVGRIYLGTEQGLDQLDPTTGRIRHFTTADGLVGNRIQHCLRDREGNIWVATTKGVSKLNPRAERAVKQPPLIYLSRIQVGGVDRAVPERGAVRLPELTLSASQNNVRIEYVGLSFQSEQALKYEYKLEGVDADWNPPTEERSVHYASLSPRTYRFVVRAMNADGLTSWTPAEIQFIILRPIWQRWWFLTLAAAFLVGVVGLIYRYRVARLLELERVRTRIATDLHDDIGSSLSRIAILSEVVKQQTTMAKADAVETLTQVAETARGLVDTMSDIVWSIDPRRDDLHHVVLRISEFASDVLEAKGMAWDFQTPPELEKVKLSLDQRRHLYLIFKEAINNIVRHADCASVSLTITLADNHLRTEICDDGCGFVAPPLSEGGGQLRQGHGLENMHARAVQLGGRLQIESGPGQGTRVTLTVPLK